MLERKLSKERTIMASKSSGSILNGEYVDCLIDKCVY